MSSSTSTAKSGIQTTESGASYIPESVRPDGSTRKAIRVRPGYRPPEDVEVYKNRTAEAWKNRGSGGVPGAEPVSKDDPNGVKSKNAKRRESAKKNKDVGKWESFATDEAEKGAVNGRLATSNEAETKGKEKEPNVAPVDEEAEKEKKARNLKKKLRQARELQGKKEHGESLLPEQFAKVVKISELIRELDKLGFDADGDKMVKDEG